MAALGVALAISGAVGGGGTISAAADTAVTSRSIAFFEGRLAADPDNFLVAGQLATRYLMRFQAGADLDDVHRAEALAVRSLRLVADTAGALARLSGIYLTQHDFARAYDAARRGVSWNPANQAALGALFDATMAQGRYAAAESVLGRLDPSRIEYRLRLGHFLDAKGNTDAAYRLTARACDDLARAQVPPQSVAWCLTELAKLAHQRAGATAARALFERALAVQPGYRGAIEGLADLVYSRGDWRRAARLYRMIAADAHPDLYLRLGEVYEALGDTAAAARYEREFLRVALAPSGEALYAHPLALYYAERPQSRDSAVAVARRDVARRPTVESWDVLSWALFQRGHLREALAASDSAHAWGAPSPTTQYHRARILAALGRRDEAAPLLAQSADRPDLLEAHAQRALRGESPRP